MDDDRADAVTVLVALGHRRADHIDRVGPRNEAARPRPIQGARGK